MCARFTLTARPQLVADMFNVPGLFDFEPRYNIAPTQSVLAIRSGPNDQPEAARLRWGLIPSWATDVSIGNRLINARSETIAEKPSFRGAFRAGRRCLIPADGFYEWRTEGGKKHPFRIYRPNNQLFAFAGLWERWEGGETPIESLTVLTTAANQRIAELHDRMPVILTDASEYGEWLNGPDVSRLLRALPDDALTFHAVRNIVNNPRHEDPRCIEPDDDNRGQPTLFDD